MFYALLSLGVNSMLTHCDLDSSPWNIFNYKIPLSLFNLNVLFLRRYFLFTPKATSKEQNEVKQFF